PEALRTQLAEGFTGELITSADPSYEERRRVWNGSIDRRPALIARCARRDDVAAALRVASESGVALAVRSGGHSFPGLSVCDDGVVIDLGLMKGVRVDPGRERVRAQAGLLLGELDKETQSFGYAVPAGIVTHTGLAGLTLGGGIGWIMRKYGLTIDNLRSVDLVTADGELVTASEQENADLFWGVRGGGGNFGVVTEFEFQMHRLGPQVVAGPVFWPAEQAREVLSFYRDWLVDCPDELMTIVVQRKAPDLPVIPRELVGRLVIAVAACYSGNVAEGERVLQPLKEFGSPVLDLCVPKPYLAHQKMFDPSFRHGNWYYVRSCDVAALTEDVIDIMAEYGQQITSPITSIALWQMGGAVARIDDNATAFNGRHAGFTFNINGNSETADGFEDQRRWARRYWDSLAPHHTSVYVNFLMEEGEERVRQAYGTEKYDRLKALKRKYDPTNFFRLNQNISPD
ncbi:MAG: FAD-binding oxidoreductase, partial [Actinomycetota bacterium]|nr:FAD-binding oxidoreductase [Actinomycetota bacterium]